MGHTNYATLLAEKEICQITLGPGCWFCQLHHGRHHRYTEDSSKLGESDITQLLYTPKCGWWQKKHNCQLLDNTRHVLLFYGHFMHIQRLNMPSDFYHLRKWCQVIYLGYIMGMLVVEKCWAMSEGYEAKLTYYSRWLFHWISRKSLTVQSQIK